MSWAALSDRMHDDPETYEAGATGFGLWAACRSWCAQHLTDGRIPKAIARAKALALRADPDAAIADCLRSGLWRDGGSDYLDARYLDENPSRERVLEKKAAAKARYTNWRTGKGARKGKAVSDANALDAALPTREQRDSPLSPDLSSLRSERSPLTAPPGGGSSAAPPSAESFGDGEAKGDDAPPWRPTPANDLAAGPTVVAGDRPRPAQRTPPSLNLPGLETHQASERPDAQRSAVAGSLGPEPDPEAPRGRTPPPEPAGEAPRRRKRAPPSPRVDLDPAGLSEGPERATYEAILADPSLSKTVARPVETARDLARTASALFDPAAEVHEAGSWTRKKPGRERPNGAAYLANWFAKARRDAEVRRAVLETTRASGGSSAQGAPAARQGSGFVPPVAPPTYRAPRGTL